jgi:flagellar hook-associated protein 1 FlgK
MSTSSISVAMGTAVSGLSVNQTALQTTSNNIANANTVGYTAKKVNLATVLLDGQGAGVQVSGITRSVNEFLLRDVRNQTSFLADATVRSSYYASTQDMFGTLDSNSSIGARLTALSNNLQALAVEPADSGNQLSVINAAVTATQQLNQMSQNIQNLRNQADDDIAGAVTNVNTLLNNIAQLNAQISRNTALHLPTGDMQDQRDQAVVQLSNYMDISYYTRPSGEMVIFSGSGRTLVDHSAATFNYTSASNISADASYPGGGIDGITLNGVDVTTEFHSGQIKGLIDMRDTDLPNLGSELDRLATVMRDQINAIHNDGTALPPPDSLTGTRTFGAPATDTVNMTGTVRIAVLNDDGTAASVPFDFSLDDLATVVGGPPTIEQIRDAINGVYAVPAPPTNPAIPGLTGATASINADGALVISANTAGQGIAINEGTSTEATTGFGFSHYFGLNDFFVGSTVGGLASNISVRSDIVANGQNLARGELNEGTLAVGDTALTSGDASIASRMANKFTENLSFASAGGLPTTNTTLSGYGASILSDNATRSADADDVKNFRQTVLADVQNKSDSASGVNMDEEMANLILYQNAYSASARVITTLSEVMKTLTDMV